jgi:hypothetical protein
MKIVENKGKSSQRRNRTDFIKLNKNRNSLEVEELYLKT